MTSKTSRTLSASSAFPDFILSCANCPLAQFQDLAPSLVDVPRRLSNLEARMDEITTVVSNTDQILQAFLNSGVDPSTIHLHATSAPQSVASPGLAPSPAASAASAATASSSGPDISGMSIAGPSRLPAGAVQAQGMCSSIPVPHCHSTDHPDYFQGHRGAPEANVGAGRQVVSRAHGLHLVCAPKGCIIFNINFFLRVLVVRPASCRPVVAPPV